MSDPTAGPTAEDRRRASAHVVVDAVGLDATIVLVDDDTEQHLRRVLRLRDGASVTATDGVGSWRTGVVRISSNQLTIEPTSAVVFEPRREPVVTIAAAIPKGERLDWMVQKTTECGVDRLVLLDCDRSVVKWKADRVERQLGRLERIAREAARQSRRVWLPEVLGPTPSDEVITGAATAHPGGEPLSARYRTVAVGPEGGWSERELGMVSLCVDLGPHVLRTETAAMVATTLCVVPLP